MPAWTVEVNQFESEQLEEPLYRVTIELGWTESEARKWFETRYLNPEMAFEDNQALELWVKAIFLLTLRESRATEGQIAIIQGADGSVRTELLSDPTSFELSDETDPS